ncbi:hypothetical protein PQX77_011288 [Marasmius sp. AFHP31]|nr:hypothetical protein PQX77_011288 [Marasmius sp. AFHP31]
MQTGMPFEARIKLRHHTHPAYVDISIPVHLKEKIRDGVENDLTPSKIWSGVLQDEPDTEITRKQVHREWTKLSQYKWRMDDDQVESSIQLLQKLAGENVTEIIPIREIEGTSAVAFGFEEILNEVMDCTEEIAVDSTWKTNALGYELYAVITEVNGEAIPLSFMFTTQDQTAPEGSKDLLLRDLLRFTKTRCPNIKFTLSDKDTSEINACRAELLDCKHQLCYWHAIRYLEKRLSENRPPAAYDPRTAHNTFTFIDPTWAPGVTIGWLEDGVHEDDAETERPVEPLKIKINLGALKNDLLATKSVPEDETDARILKLKESLKFLEEELKDLKTGGRVEDAQAGPTSMDQAAEKTCRPPLFILKHGDKRVKFWPSPPAMKGLTELPVFCPKEHREPVVELFRRHLHLHETIPIDEFGTKRTAAEIWSHATQEMYYYCYTNSLAQTWAYLWNRWYSRKQWVLWARAACKLIPRIKTTMIVESTWKQLKRNDLPQFNRPRLDLVTHVIFRYLHPRVLRKILNLKGLRRKGRSIPLSPWAESLRSAWKKYEKTDSQRTYQRELEELGNNRQVTEAERAEIEAEVRSELTFPEQRYYTCTQQLAVKTGVPTPLAFFRSLRRSHCPPFYSIPGINAPIAASPSDDSDDEEEVDMVILGLEDTVKRARSSRASTASRASSVFDGSSVYDVDEIQNVLVDGEEEGHEPSHSEVAEPFDDSETSRIFISDAEADHINQRWETIMAVARNSRGLHPTMHRGIKRVWDMIDQMGGEIQSELGARSMRRTYKDNTSTTMFMD